MPTPRTGTRLLAAACALTLLLAACGGDDDSSDSSDPAEETTAPADDGSTTEAPADESTTTEAPAEPTSDRTPEEAQAIVEGINLTLDDFADGWEAEDDGDAADEGDELDACIEAVDIEATTVFGEETPQFSADNDAGQGQIVNMQTVVFDSEETATALMAEVEGDAFATCAEELFASSFEADGGQATVDLTATADDPPLAEESVGVAGAISATAPDGTVTDGLVDLHVIRTADVVSFTLVLDIGDVGFQSTLEELYGVIAARHAANVA